MIYGIKKLKDNYQINPRDYFNYLRSLLDKNVICKEAEIIFYKPKIN